MKPILVAAPVSACIAVQAAAAAPVPGATATTVAATPTKARPRCVREREVGSDRVKRGCLTEEQRRSLSDAERADLIRAERSAAEILGD